MRKVLVDSNPTLVRINVTPIIDVALTLVIIMFITAPIIAVSDVSIQLPVAKTRSVKSDARLFVTLGSDGRLGVDDRNIPTRDLERAIAARIAESGEDPLVVVRADQGVPYESVATLLKRARSAGAKRLAIATTQSHELAAESNVPEPNDE